MKKVFMSLLFASALFSFSMSADDKPIAATELPAEATAFIKNFAPATVTAASVDDDFFRPDYKVFLSDGTVIEFRHNGRWEEISNYKGINTKVIPAAIANYLNTNHKGVAVTDMSYDAGDIDAYEIRLASRLELKFDRNGNFLTAEYDD